MFSIIKYKNAPKYCNMLVFYHSGGQERVKKSMSFKQEKGQF